MKNQENVDNLCKVGYLYENGIKFNGLHITKSRKSLLYGRGWPKVLKQPQPAVWSICWWQTWWQHRVIITPPVSRSWLAPGDVVFFECLHLLLEANEAVEHGDFHSHIRWRCLVQHAGELERTR